MKKRLVAVRSTTGLPSPAAARPTLALRRSRPITRPRLGRWTLSTMAGRTSVAARRVLCSPSCALPPVTGLGVGFAGEFSRKVGQFISAVAEKGAVVPGRFGCCHSSDQARGVIASFVRRAFNRTSLRGVARIRQAALTAILGGWVERRAPTPLLTAPWRVPRTHGARLAGTSTAVPAPVVNWRRDITAAPGAETGPLLT